MSEAMTRRRFLSNAGQLSLAATAGGAVLLADGAEAAVSPVGTVPTDVTRTWLGPDYWSNRLQDWRLNSGRFECLSAVRGGGTVGVLTRSIAAGDSSGSLTVRTGTLAAGTGFSGFVIGTGAGRLDWRAAALVMRASGEGGGFLAVYDSDGRVRFREHTNEVNQFAYAALPSGARSGAQPARTLTEDVTLRLDIAARGGGLFDLTLSARATATGALLSTTKRVGVPEGDLVGGISLISTARAGNTTARYWLAALATSGPKVAVHDRAVGPVLGTLYSLAGSVLKMTAQLLPIASTEPQDVVLQTRVAGTTSWTTRQTVRLGAGFVGSFRVTGWDAARDHEYRVVHALGTAAESAYGGVVRREPSAEATVKVAMVNCTIHTFRNLDIATRRTQALPGAQPLGLYTRENLYFPYAETASAIGGADPDLFVAFGDQYYEGLPTAADRASPLLDMLTRYYLWLWSFGEITRRTPTICLVDDHDVYHRNLWGWSGRAAPNGNYEYGGYLMPASWVNIVQRVQCSHNPDAYDPTPVLQGISVYYSAFSYGGVSFAVLEDRKFKNTTPSGTDEFGNPLPQPRQLLGERQEGFLTAWAAMHPGQPKVCLTQTLFACVQTRPNGGRATDSDSNGTPVTGRVQAVQLLRRAGAVVLSGDQHLGTVVRHGVTSYTDGPVQFTAPAAGTAWQRWFEPATALPNASGPNTGDFVDGFGNKFRVLAVANPKVTFAEVRAVQTSNDVGDRRLKREGYGIAEIDKGAKVHRLHCWPWDQGPTVVGAAEYPGWPYTLPFSAV